MSDNPELDAEFELVIFALEAERGTVRTLQINDESLDVTIPPGTKSRAKLRLKGKGNKKAGLFGGGERGDLYITILIEEERENWGEQKKVEERVIDSRYRYEYEVVKIERDNRYDTAVVEEAQRVIEKYARQGWKLHTYSQVALSTGAAMPIASVPFSNVLHLVFERERHA